MNRVAICHYKGRVAPRYDHTDEFLMVTVNHRRTVVEKKIMVIGSKDTAELAQQLSHQKIRVLICGGVRDDWKQLLEKNNITLIDNVIGNVDDVLKKYIENSLSSGDTVS